MKKTLSTLSVLLALAFSLTANADVKKMDSLLRSALSRPAAMKSILGKAVTIKAEREMIECLVKTSDTIATTEAIKSAGGEVRAVIGNIMSTSIPTDALANISDRPDVLYIEAARPLTSKMNVARTLTGVADVQAGTGLDKAYNGENVLVGVVDNTIDWQNTDFSNTDGKTRICYVYEETATGGIIECTKTEIDDDECDATEGGSGYHGTHVTGIAASSNSTYTGVAPKSCIAFAFNSPLDADSSESFSTTVLDGVLAIFAKADSLELPAVINLSLGTSWGAHDDTSLLEQGLDSAVSGVNGRVIVNAAGNENVNANDNAENSNHLGGIHADINEDITNRGWKIVVRDTYISEYVGAAVVDVWLDDTADCRGATIEVKAYKQTENNYLTANDKLQMTAIGFAADASTSKETTDGNVEVSINTYTKNGQNSRPEALILFGPSATGSWDDIVRTSTADDGYFFDVVLRVPSGTCKGSMWLYPDQTGLIDFLKGYAGTEVAGTGSYQLADGDSNKTTTIPGTASGVITVGSYMGRGTWVDINGVTHNQTDYDSSIGATGGTVGNISLFSSLGPTGEAATSSQRIKPDVIAPGEPIISTKASANSFADALLGDATHEKLEGTSMSSPHVAGIVALMLEKNNCLTASEIKSYLTTSATHIATDPDNTNGYGKVNALAAMEAITSDTSCYAGRDICGSGGGGGGGSGCSGSVVPVSAATGIVSILAIAIPLGIFAVKRRKSH